MTTSKEELLNKLSECVLEMEDEEVVDVAEEYIEAGLSGTGWNHGRSGRWYE